MPAERRLRATRPAVKICGVTRLQDAEMAIDLGASYLGLNFWPGTKRVIDLERARAITEAVRGRIGIVGVFVNATADEIARIDDQVGLDFVQLSGDEPPSEVARWSPRAIKAFRAGAEAADQVDPFTGAWAWLFDAPHPSLYGGTGEGWDVAALPLASWRSEGRRVFVAGGIGPESVRRLLLSCQPDVLDVCSRVESSPGIKDGSLMRRLFEEIEDVEAQTLS
jgi:phosphoribosylanthranilate isomerase